VKRPALVPAGRSAFQPPSAWALSARALCAAPLAAWLACCPTGL